jgi:hypothetical protein
LQSYTDCNGDIDGCYFSNSDLYSDGNIDGCYFSNSDLYSDSDGYSTYTDGYGNVDGCGISNSNRNGNGDAHTAAYPDAETGSDTNAAPDSDAIALAATDATLIGTIQAGTREQNSRVPCL